MARHSRWIGITGFLILLISCFMPWAYYADLGKNFTGFFSEQNIYGSPGKFLLILGGISILFTMLPAVWMKRVALFSSAINIAYSIVIYIRFGACYKGYCPQLKPGLFLMVLGVALIFIACVFPSGEVKAESDEAAIKEVKAAGSEDTGIPK